jgi:ParB/RepB/Spo0J family partition protein
MNENLNPSYLDIPIDRIGESFGRLRLLSPCHEAAMERSVGRFGQLTPVVVSAAKNDHYEIIDGFKRLRACRKLGKQSLKARVLEGHGRVFKAAMIQLNLKCGHLGDVEEAMIVASLYRDDGLTQVEIAPLLGRDKSWVSRRIALIERLSEEVLEHLRLGLISPTHGRELSRLPRGNQHQALSCVVSHRLCSRETAKLVAMLIERPRWDHEMILRLPLEILEHREPPKKGLVKPKESLTTALKDLERCCSSVVKEMELDPIFPSHNLDPPVVAALIAYLEKILNMLKTPF